MNERERTDGGARGEWPDRVMVLALLAAVTVAVIRVLTHHPFHDEGLHVQKLFLMSKGLTPHVDFWCNYPVPAYVLTLPFFSVLPLAASSLFALRFLMLGLFAAVGVLLTVHGRRVASSWIWGAAPAALVLTSPPLGRFLAEYSIDHFAMLAAVGAIVLFFTRPRPLRIGAAAALCLLSVAFTPKYALPLFFGMAGYAGAALIAPRRRLRSLIALVLGAAAAAALVVALYEFGGTSFTKNVEYAHVLMGSFKFGADAAPVSLFVSTMWVLIRTLPLLALIVLGIVGWWRSRRARPAPLGLLFGTLASAFLTQTFMVQYILPVILCLAAFAPFAALLRTPAVVSRWIPPGLAVVTLVMTVPALTGAVGEIDETPANIRDPGSLVAERIGVRMAPPAIETISIKQRILDLVPPDGFVIAAPEMHPLFRKDLTFITADERPSFATLIAESDPARPKFESAHLARRLAESPPAYICLTTLDFNGPPGWREVLEEYLRRNPRRYVRLDGYPDSFLRADLIR